jgi:hypothetical protein
MTLSKLFSALALSIERYMFVHVFYYHQLNAWNWVCLEKPTFSLLVWDSTPFIKTEVCHSVPSRAWWVWFRPIAFILSDHFQLLHTKISNHNIIYSSKKPRKSSSLPLKSSSQLFSLDVSLIDVRVFISLEINTYPRRIRRSLNLGHIFRKNSASYRLGYTVLSSLTFSDHISQPHNTTDIIVSLLILSPKSLNIFKDSKLNGSRHIENLISI